MRAICTKSISRPGLLDAADGDGGPKRGVATGDRRGHVVGHVPDPVQGRDRVAAAEPAALEVDDQFTVNRGAAAQSVEQLMAMRKQLPLSHALGFLFAPLGIGLNAGVVAAAYQALVPKK